MRKELTLLLTFIPLVLETVQVSDCYEIESADSEQVWQIMKLSAFDSIFLLSAGSLSIALLFITVLTWFLYRSFSTPSDIMFAIVLSQLLENSTLVIQAGYFQSTKNYLTKPENFQTHCFWMGIFNIIGNVFSTYYNLIFCIVLSYSIRNTLKGSVFNQYRYHVLSLLITSAVILALVLTQSLGRGLNGVCGYKVASRQSTVRFVLQLFISSACIYSMINFKKKIPRNEYFKKQSVFGFYYYYMGIFATTQIISSLSYLIGDIMCRSSPSIATKVLHVFYSISLSASIFLSYAIVSLRFYHPLLLQKILKLIKRKDRLSQRQKQIIQFEMAEEDNTDEQSLSWLGCLLQSLKGSQILSFLEGITVAFIQKEKKFICKELTPLSYQRHYTFTISQQIVQNFLQRHDGIRQSFIVRQQLGGLIGLEYQVVSYCPQVFSSLCTKGQIRQIIKSLGIRRNIKIVRKQSHTNGGKSGQLFFNTFDNRLMFKTIRQDQALSYLSKIRQFSQHFSKEKLTLIVKILGIFRFQRQTVKEQPIYIMLMYNITMFPRELNIRVYDIKGSQFNRSAMQQNNIRHKQRMPGHQAVKGDYFSQLQKNIRLKQQALGSQTSKGSKVKQTPKNIRNEQQELGQQTSKDVDSKSLQNSTKNKQQKLRKYTLKDKDFKQLQNKVRIDTKFSIDLKRIARRDIQFLGSLGLMDYSLLIIKRQGKVSSFQRGLSELKSQQEGIIYNFGIIDYLQSWTLKRKAQRVLKTLITRQQVTANSPMNYSSRLCEFIDSIF